MKNTLVDMFLRQLEIEELSARKCIERIPESTFEWKPHEKSMQMGYLTLLVVDIPGWIAAMVTDGVIDFATWPKYTEINFADRLTRFEENMTKAKEALKNATYEDLADKMFILKSGDHELMKTPVLESIATTFGHWVHHRGQLTVYMRLNDILVPSIYGPSADDPNF